jgi:hypothetical protein
MLKTRKPPAKPMQSLPDLRFSDIADGKFDLNQGSASGAANYVIRCLHMSADVEVDRRFSVYAYDAFKRTN